MLLNRSICLTYDRPKVTKAIEKIEMTATVAEEELVFVVAMNYLQASEVQMSFDEASLTAVATLLVRVAQLLPLWLTP